MSTDFEVVDEVHVESCEAVSRVLQSIAGPVRVAGAASTQHRVPAPPEPVTLLRLHGLDRILRLEPGDMTCSVEPGVPIAALDAALAEHRLCLPIERDFGTTVGGVFARGERMPAAPSQHSTRSLILGMRAVLAEGLEFKAGAKVVKSVAGFDLQKAFVGSRGRLCVATELHIKVRPLPEASTPFSHTGLDREHATSRFCELRRLSSAPTSLYLTRSSGDAFAVSGSFSGRARIVESQLRSHALEPSESVPNGLEPHAGDWITGLATVAELPCLLDVVPDSSWLRVSGGSQFDVTLDPADTDSVMRELAGHGFRAEVVGGASDRRGHTTDSPDERARRLEDDLRRALDPTERLR